MNRMARLQWPSPKIMNDRTKIGLHMKTTGDLARQLRKCTGYMPPSQPLAAQSLLRTYVPSSFTTELDKRGRGNTIYDRTCIFDHNSGYTQLFRAQIYITGCSTSGIM